MSGLLHWFYGTQFHHIRFFLQRVTEEMENFLQELKSKVKVALVGGSDLVKIAEQMGGDDGKSEFRPPDKSVYLKIIFLITQPKHMLWVLKRTVSMRRFF